MKHSIPNELKEQNRQLTEECLKIYNSIKFAEIKSRGLRNAVVPIVFTFVFAFSVGYLFYFITTAFWWCIGFFAFLTLLCTVAVIISWYFVLNDRKYGRPWYFIRDDKNEYQVWCNYDGQIYTAQTIVDLTCHKVLYVDKNGICSIDNDEDTASKVTGFYQYIVTPDKVYDSCVRSAAMRRDNRLRYKRKKSIGDRTYYYFPALNNAVFGAKYARCIMLKNGVVKYICVETASGHASDDKTSTYTRKYLYGNVNDIDRKIYIQKYVQDYARSVKFRLPESQNVIYEI